MIDSPRSSPIRAGAFLLAAAAAGVLAVAADGGADWPQFRGPSRDGVSLEKGLSAAWGEQGPPVLWRRPLGQGYSGLSVYRGRIYTMFARDGGEFAAAIDAASGETAWERRIDEAWSDRQGDGPRSTPTVHQGIVYVLGARGKLFALNAGDGEPLWSHDLRTAYGAEPPQWGASTSPLVEGDLLLVDAGGAGDAGILAFHRKTGRRAWGAEAGPAGYAAPIAFTAGGVRQALFFTARHLIAVAPSDGSVLWEIPWKTSYDVNAAAPVFIPPDRFFVSSGYDVGGAVYRIAIEGGRILVEQLWKNREMKNQFSSSVHVDGQLYGFDDKTLKCLDAGTGRTLWRERGLGHGSLTWVDGHLIVLGDRGTLVLVEARSDAYREVARAQVFEGKTWTVPTYAGGRLYLRDERELVALDVAR